MPLRLVLIEDHPVLQQNLQLLLEQRGHDVVGTCGDSEAARALVDAKAPDVVVLGVHLGQESGIALTRELLAREPARRIVLFTGSSDPELALAGMEAGALGYALDDGDPVELLQAIDSAAEDRRHVDSRLRLVHDVPPTLDEESERRHARGVLTRREREIMNLLAQGHTGEQVATLLVLSAQTVKTHIRNAMVRLDATTRVHAIALGLRDGELSPPGAAAARPPRRP